MVKLNASHGKQVGGNNTLFTSVNCRNNTTRCTPAPSSSVPRFDTVGGSSANSYHFSNPPTTHFIVGKNLSAERFINYENSKYSINNNKRVKLTT
jgi:hypothetical protein